MSNRVKLPFRIGCDPEVALHMGDKNVDAQTAQALCKYSASYAEGSIGMDCGMAELRPEPAFDIIDLAKNIKAILKKTADKIGFMDWDASSKFNSSGGHIHLEVKKEMVKSEYGQTPKVQDYIRKFFSFYLPVTLADDFKHTNRRRTGKGGGYGQWGDVRVERKSKGYTYEIRTPSAQWLICPKTTLATFAYMVTLHNEIINHPEHMKDFPDIIVKNQQEYKTIEDVAYNGYSAFVDPLLGKIKRAVKTFELYPKFKKEINWLFDSEKVQKEKEKYNWDVLKGWGLEPKHATLGQLTNKRSIEARMKRFNHSQYANSWNNIMPFQFNDDFNIATWSHELNKRIIAFNWKIQHRYIFYGLKKGTIDEAIVSDAKMRIHIGQKGLNTEEKMAIAKRGINKMIQRYAPNGSIYLVGLPYDMRKKNDFKFLVEFMYYMENQLPGDALATTKEYELTLMDLSQKAEAPREVKKPKEYKDNVERQNEALMAGLKPVF